MCPYDDGSRNEGDLQRRKNFRRNGRSDSAGAAEKTEGTASVDGSTGYHGGCEPGACQNPRFRNRTIPPENKDRDGADIISDIAVSGAQNETFSYTEKEWRITIMETNYPAFTVPRGFKCRNNREINDTHTNLTTSIYCSKPSSITSPVESKRTELRALR